MNRLSEYRYMFGRNLIPLIGFSLFVYFSYHIIQGERSYLRLRYLDSQMQIASTELSTLSEERSVIEKKVVMLRPETLDLDMLEERVRHVLGFVHDDERVLFDSRH